MLFISCLSFSFFIWLMGACAGHANTCRCRALQYGKIICGFFGDNCQGQWYVIAFHHFFFTYLMVSIEYFWIHFSIFHSHSPIRMRTEIFEAIEIAGICGVDWCPNGGRDIFDGPRHTRHTQTIFGWITKTLGCVGASAAGRRCICWSGKHIIHIFCEEVYCWMSWIVATKTLLGKRTPLKYFEQKILNGRRRHVMPASAHSCLTLSKNFLFTFYASDVNGVWIFAEFNIRTTHDARRTKWR